MSHFRHAPSRWNAVVPAGVFIVVLHMGAMDRPFGMGPKPGREVPDASYSPSATERASVGSLPPPGVIKSASVAISPTGLPTPTAGSAIDPASPPRYGQTEIVRIPGTNVSIEMVYLPPGSFMMGSLQAEKDRDEDERPRHLVTLQEFWMGKHEVTQDQWKAVMGSYPGSFKRDVLPVDRVSWHDCKAFIQNLNVILGEAGGFRLPSEAEWEYACRAGRPGRYCFGSNESQLSEYAWYQDNSGGHTHPVGQKRPNAWGLRDMHGNVWEWCEDGYHDDYYGASVNGTAWQIPASPFKVLRGGSSNANEKICRTANRFRLAPGAKNLTCGFRLARSR